MRVLVANVGSTSYKYTLFDVVEEQCVRVAGGGIERVTNYAGAIEEALADLKKKADVSPQDIDAVAFKTVLGKNLSGLVNADERAIKALDDMAEVAPAHNPPYIGAIRAFEKILPRARRMALFETSFYAWAPRAWFRYAIPKTWHEAGIKRNGFHGASHKYAAERAAQICGREDAAESARMLYVNKGPLKLGTPFRSVNCHLGGSSSVCGILNGAAIGASMGFSPQGGLPQNNRVGDLDPMAVSFAIKTLGLTLEDAMQDLSKRSGLLGISGVSNDLRDIIAAAKNGNDDAKLAIEVLNHSTRTHIGGFVANLGGLDCISFSGGIGENDAEARAEILRGFAFMGLELDEKKNAEIVGKKEGLISAPSSKIKAAVVCADEEIVIAREVARALANEK